MLKKDIVVTFFGQVASVGLGILGAALLARALGPDGRGLYALAILLPLTIERCMDSGLIGVNSTFAGLYKKQRKALFAQTVLFTLVVSLLGILGVVACFFWLPVDIGKFSAIPTHIVWISLILLPASIIYNLLRELARGTGMIASTVLITNFGAVLRALLIVIFLTLLAGGLDAAIWITVGIPIILTVCHIWQTRKFATLDLRNLSLPLLKDTFSFGGILTLSSAAKFLGAQASLFLLTFMKVSLIDIGLFSIAVLMSRQIQIVPTSISQAFLPRASNDPEARLKQTPLLFRYTVIICFSTMIALAIICPCAMYVLYGKRFIGSIIPCLVMLPGVMMFGSSRILGVYLWVRKKPQYTMINNWITLIVTVCIGLALIGPLGILGAAIACCAGDMLLFFLTIRAYKKVSGTETKELIVKSDDFKFIWTQLKSLPGKLLSKRSVIS